MLRGTRIVARGPKARGAIQAAGLTADWVAESETSAEIAEVLLDEGVAGRDIAVQHHGAGADGLDEAFAAAGARVRSLVVYRWGPPPDPAVVEASVRGVAAGEVDAVVFTSAPGAAAWLAAADDAGVTDQIAPWPAAAASSWRPSARSPPSRCRSAGSSRWCPTAGGSARWCARWSATTAACRRCRRRRPVAGAPRRRGARRARPGPHADRSRGAPAAGRGGRFGGPARAGAGGAPGRLERPPRRRGRDRPPAGRHGQPGADPTVVKRGYRLQLEEVG